MNVIDLFSGIGGFSLGLERAGFKTVAFCEIDPYCQAVLRKHWPDVPVWGDVRTLTAKTLSHAISGRCHKNGNGAAEGQQPSTGRAAWGEPSSSDCPRPDVVCGGFPCQDISIAGKGAGIEGERSGLWSEYARIIGEVRPKYVIVENVAALLGRGLGRVLGDLAALGYDCEWHCIPASAVGAPHRRDRVWIVAQSVQYGPQRALGSKLQSFLSGEHQSTCRPNLEDTASAGRNGTGAQQSTNENGSRSFREPSRSDWWLSEPNVGRVANEFSPRMDGDLNAAQLGTKEGRAAGSLVGGQILREMQFDSSTAKAPFGLQQTARHPNFMSEMPCEGRPGRRPPQDKADETLQSVWKAILALPQQEAQYLQRRMSRRDWQAECNDPMGWWATEPPVPRVAKGVNKRVDRLRALGNAIVPQIAEIIGRAIMGVR